MKPYAAQSRRGRLAPSRQCEEQSAKLIEQLGLLDWLAESAPAPSVAQQYWVPPAVLAALAFLQASKRGVTHRDIPDIPMTHVWAKFWRPPHLCCTPCACWRALFQAL